MQYQTLTIFETYFITTVSGKMSVHFCIPINLCIFVYRFIHSMTNVCYISVNNMFGHHIFGSVSGSKDSFDNRLGVKQCR
jgi:hypothetical protein